MQNTLTILTGSSIKKIPFSAPQKLTALIDGVRLLCGGNGTCGKCCVRAQGELSAPTAQEKAFFARGAEQEGWRLACQVTLLGDAQIELPLVQALTNITSSGAHADYPFLPCKGSYAAAIDLGTTTLALGLVNLKSGETVSEVSCENPQVFVAADVIGRINAAMHGCGARLQMLVTQAVRELISAACANAQIQEDMVSYFVIAGNTTMLYLLTGRNPASLAHAPFQADFLFGVWDGKKYYPPCVSAFIGADITCAILACGMCETAKTSLLIDIGTNGEIALFHEGKLYCCSTAAGPAFEGGGISRGVGSVRGAIDSVCFENGAFTATTIGAKAPVGICGSGVIDAVAALLDAELLDETGALEKPEVLICGDISFTQSDVRMVQLAKGAIAAGAKTLAAHAGIQFANIDTLYIAGGFGKHINAKSAVKIGLIPAALEEKLVILGNASLCGATVHLLCAPMFSRAKEIARMAQPVPLAGTSAFSDNYMQCMLIAPLN